MKIQNTNIVRFLTAQTISLLGSSIVQYAIIWYITLTTKSGGMMTIATICGFLPQVLISLFAGVWVDKYNRKKLIIISDAIIAVATLILSVLFLFGHKNIWLIFTVLIIRSAGAGIQTPAVQAIIPQLISKEKLMRVSGINSSITSLIMFLSPAIAGFILSIFSITLTLQIDVITAVIGIAIMFTVKIAPRERIFDKAKSNLKQIVEGFSYVKKQTYIISLILFLILVAILISPSAFLTPLLIARNFGTQMWKLTASEMVFSAGAAVGGLIISVWGGFRNRMHTTILATLFYGIFMILIGNSTIFIFYLIFNFLIGITMPCFNSPIIVLLQEKVEPNMHGRVFSLVQIASSCSLPLGMVIFGPMADMIKVETILVFAGVAVIAIASFAYFSKKFTV